MVSQRYVCGQRSGQAWEEETAEEGSKKKEAKAPVTASAEAARTIAQPVPINKKKKGATADRIVEILQAKPGVEFTAQQIAEQIGLASIPVTHMVLANLVNAHRAEKTASGKYRALTAEVPKPHGMHAAV